jgi:hypothetical protein
MAEMVGSRRLLRGLFASNMALQRTPRPRFLKVHSGAGGGVPVQEHAGTGRSLRSLGAPLNARLLAAAGNRFAPATLSEVSVWRLDGAPPPAR